MSTQTRRVSRRALLPSSHLVLAKLEQDERMRRAALEANWKAQAQEAHRRMTLSVLFCVGMLVLFVGGSWLVASHSEPLHAAYVWATGGHR